MGRFAGILTGAKTMEATAFWNLDAEIATLGAALQEQKCAEMLAELPNDTYYDARHQAIHAAVCRLVKAGSAVDLITADTEINRSGQSEAVGGTAYLVSLITQTPTTANQKHYIRIIEQCAMRRKLRMAAKELADRIGDAAQDPNEVREWAARAVREIRLGNNVELISMRDAALRTYEQMERDQKNDGQSDQRIMTGIESLDKFFGGFRAGQYVAIGARPSVGKSILALTACVNAAKQGKRALLVSLEMSEVEITERILANEGDVPLNVITSGNVSIDMWQNVAGALTPVSNLPLWCCLEASTVEQIRQAAYQLYENGGIDLIAIDYLQLMEAGYSRNQNRQEQISEISRGIKKLAMELKIPILVLTQLNRESVMGSKDGIVTKREPTMSEARGSGSIEQDANIFILMHDPGLKEMQSTRDEDTWSKLEAKGMTMIQLIIEKNRQGKKGRIKLAFDGSHMRFLRIKDAIGGEEQ